MGQIVSAPATSDRKEVTPLGYVESHDAVIKKDYAYAAYKETDTKSGKWHLKIKASCTVGASLDPEHRSVRTNISKAAVAGKDHITFGCHMAPKEGDQRKVENRIYFDEHLAPTRVEIELVTRNDDGSPGEPQCLEFDWPGEPPEEKQLLTLPKSTDRKAITQLAYLSSYDVPVDKYYAYLAYKEEDTKSGKWIVRISATCTAGGSLDPNHASFQKNIDAAAGKGDSHVIVGFQFKGKEDDSRVVENRVHFGEDKKPTHVEIHLVTRNADGSPKERKVAKFDWPA